MIQKTQAQSEREAALDTALRILYGNEQFTSTADVLDFAEYIRAGKLPEIPPLVRARFEP